MAAIEEDAVVRPVARSGGLRAALSSLPKGFARRKSFGDFGPAPRILELVLLAAVAVLSARLFWLIFAPLPVPDGPPAVIRPVATGEDGAASNPFTTMPAAATSAAAAQQPDEVRETTLDLRLHGAWGETAYISKSGGRQIVYRVGDEITGGVTLEAIYANQVTINRNGVIESLKLPKEFIDQAPGVRPARTPPAPAIRSGTNADGAAAARSRAGEPSPSDGAASTPVEGPRTGGAKAPASIMDLVRFEPQVGRDGVIGLAIYAKADGEAFANAGLQDGDLVVSVENRPVSDIGDLLPELAGKDTVRIVVERNGAQVPLVISLSPEDAFN